MYAKYQIPLLPQCVSEDLHTGMLRVCTLLRLSGSRSLQPPSSHIGHTWAYPPSHQHFKANRGATTINTLASLLIALT